MSPEGWSGEIRFNSFAGCSTEWIQERSKERYRKYLGLKEELVREMEERANKERVSVEQAFDLRPGAQMMVEILSERGVNDG